MKKLIFNIIKILTFKKWSLYLYFGFIIPVICNTLEPDFGKTYWYLSLLKGFVNAAIFVALYYLLFKKEIKIKDNYFKYNNIDIKLSLSANNGNALDSRVCLTLDINDGFKIKKEYNSYLNLAMSLGYLNPIKIKREEFVTLYSLFKEEIEYFNMNHTDINRRLKVINRKNKLKNIIQNEKV